MTRKYLLTAHNDVYFSSVKYKVICALTLLWIGKREEPMQVQEKVPKGNDSERGLNLLSRHHISLLFDLFINLKETVLIFAVLIFIFQQRIKEICSSVSEPPYITEKGLYYPYLPNIPVIN